MKDIKKALYFSAEKHDGQYRKGGKVPYIAHPMLVAFGVRDYTNDEEIIAAALLHDVLEDCPDVSLDMLQKEFSDRVVRMVTELTIKNDGQYATWQEKKEAYLAKIKEVSKDALIIIAVDKMSNFQSYFEALKNGSEIVHTAFKGTPDQYYWYYSAIGEVLVSILDDHPVVKDYLVLLKSYQ